MWKSANRDHHFRQIHAGNWENLAIFDSKLAEKHGHFWHLLSQLGIVRQLVTNPFGGQ